MEGARFRVALLSVGARTQPVPHGSAALLSMARQGHEHHSWVPPLLAFREPARAHLDDRRRPTLLDDERQRTHAGTPLGVVLARWRKTHGQQCAGAAVLRTARARLPDPAYAAVRLQEREEFPVVVRRPARRLPSQPCDRHAY